MATTEEKSKDVRWKDKVIIVKGIGFSNEIYSRHHRSKFTYMGTDFHTIAQMTAWVVALMGGNQQIARELTTGADAGYTEGNWLDLGFRNLLVHAEDEPISVFAATMATVDKFLTTETLFDALVGTGDDLIIDVSPNLSDSFWSIGYDESNMWENIDKWGRNELGEILMIVRFILSRDRHEVYGNRPTDDKISNLAMEAVRVYKRTVYNDWKWVVKELEKEQEAEIKTKEQKP